MRKFGEEVRVAQRDGAQGSSVKSMLGEADIRLLYSEA
jgi:hypothetical protein